MNKKLDRFKQWAGERMGSEIKTNATDDFKALEAEMSLRQDGMDRLHRSMTTYVKSLSRKTEGEGDKLLPVGYLGATMVGHGQDFQVDSEFGNCLINLGRANEVIARKQEVYAAQSTAVWLESLERSLAQMKEYQAARRKLEQRRLAYDTSLSKMQKAKREDFRVEEELRSQKAKYDESHEDVTRRMQDIQDSELQSIDDLSTFLEVQLAYFDQCREILLQVKSEWPTRTQPQQRNLIQARDFSKPTPRPRANTVQPRSEYRFDSEDEGRSTPVKSIKTTPRREFSGPETIPIRPSAIRAHTEDGDSFRPPVIRVNQRLPRSDTEPWNGRSQLRPVKHHDAADVFGDAYSDYGDRTDSPTDTHTSNASTSDFETHFIQKKAPPPPPPSRTKKPPPPPPVKRAALMSTITH